MARAMWPRTQLVAIAVVAAGALLAGCSMVGTSSGVGNSGPSGEATPKQTDSAETVDTTDPATCLIGTWQEDLVALTKTGTEEMKKRGGNNDFKVKWSGGAFLRFDHEGMFFVWTEDATFESWMSGSHSKTVGNGNSVGDYSIVGDDIHWSNYTTLNHEMLTYVDGQLVDGFELGDLGEFSIPGPFTCTKNKLEVKTGSTELAIPRYYDRIEGKTPKY